MKIDFHKAVSLIDSYKLMCYPPHYPALYAWNNTNGIKYEEIAQKISFKSAGVYINIPFCPSKCKFCFLDVYEYKERDKVYNFINGLKKEIELYGELLKYIEITSIYIAGGTTTILNENEIELIFKLLYQNFNLSKIKQITVETSADFLNLNKIKILKNYGVNLLMLGIQTFDENIIKKNNRVQNIKKIESIINLIKKYTIPFNIDLICGLSNVDSFIKDFKKIIKLQPELIHINKIKPIFDIEYKKKIEQMQKYAIDFLVSYGYKKIDEESVTKNGIKNIQGDMKYLSENSIIGIGPNAMGHIYGKLRYKNFFDTSKYLNRLRDNQLPWEMSIDLNETDEIDFYLLTSLPLSGVNLDTINKKFPNSKNYIEKKIKLLQKNKIIKKERNRLVMEKDKWFDFTKSIYKEKYLKKISNYKSST